MINSTYQIWPITEVRSRAQTAGESVTSIKVFSGHVFPGAKTGVVIADIRKVGDKWPDAQFTFLEKHNGSYTAVLFPTKETMYLDSSTNTDNRFPFSYDFPMNGYGSTAPAQGSQYQSMEAMQLINKILELEKRVFQLSEDKKRLAEELREFNTSSGKFQHALMGVLDQWVLPKLGFNNELNFNQNTMPIQGQEQQDFNWQGHPVADLESGLMVLVAAFGDDMIIRFAKRIQQNPSLINTLSSMM